MKWLFAILTLFAASNVFCQQINTKNISDNLGREINSYSKGNKWVYEQSDFLGGGNSQIKYKSFSIIDTVRQLNNTKYIVRSLDTFYVDNGKMLFWDNHFKEYIMYYDWTSTTSYPIKYYNRFTQKEEIASVVIDSTSFRHFGDDSLKVQYVHILNNGTVTPYIDSIFEGVGAGTHDFKLFLGCGLCDFNPQTTKLRCFTNESKTYNFVPYPFDSTWFTTATNDINFDNIGIYPNPTTDMVHMRGIDKEISFEIYSIFGQLLDKGITHDRTIKLPNTGMNLVKLKIEGIWLTKKIVKLE